MTTNKDSGIERKQPWSRGQIVNMINKTMTYRKIDLPKNSIVTNLTSPIIIAWNLALLAELLKRYLEMTKLEKMINTRKGIWQWPIRNYLNLLIPTPIEKLNTQRRQNMSKEAKNPTYKWAPIRLKAYATLNE